jgi:hypothetical protein
LLSFGAGITDVPGGNATYSFSGNGNYNAASGTVPIVLSKADATLNIVGYTGIYDGDPHQASGTASGVKNEDLSSLLSFGAGITDVPGGNATYSFAGNGNYNAASGTVPIVLSKADATVTVNGYSGTYDAAPHGAAGSVVGVAGDPTATGSTLDLGNSFTNAPGGAANWTFDGGTNYNDQSGTASIVINKADQQITWSNPNAITYGNLLGTTQLNATVQGVSGGTSPGGLTYDPEAGSLLNAGIQTLHVDAAATVNYNPASKDVTILVNQRPITITPDPSQFKYCGQADPVFIYTASEDLVTGNSFVGSLARQEGNDVGAYNYTLGTLNAGDNYSLSLAGNNTFEIKSVIIDASASSVAIQLSTPATTLKASVFNTNGNPASGVNVSFKVINDAGATVASGSAISIAGVAGLNINISSFPIGLYRVEAVAGLACASSTAYMTIYDPNGNFITGGGWIMSPLGALKADATITGKANFGFNAKYKKGSNLVDGNTEFQFQAGDFNFKSNLLGTGSLVISGAKATYRGSGTVNGFGNYGFMVSAIDGSVTGGGGADKFRIKIWDQSDGNTVVYDNQLNAPENVDATTVLGGGSIVIHSTKNNSSRLDNSFETLNRPVPIDGALTNNSLNVKVFPNPAPDLFTFDVKSSSNEKIKVVIADVSGRAIEQRTDILPNSIFQLGDWYHPGVYIAQIIQGNEKVTVKIVKGRK